MKETTPDEQVFSRAMAMIASGDQTGALSVLSELYARLTNSGELSNAAKVGSNMALIEAEMGLYGEAEIHFRTVADLFSRLGESALLARTWGNLGSVHRDAEDFNSALEAYIDSLRLYQELNDVAGIAGQYANIAYIKALSGELDSALDFFRNAEQCYSATGDAGRMRDTQSNCERLEKLIAGEGNEGA